MSDAPVCGVLFSKKLLHPRYWLTWLTLGLGFFVALMPVFFRHTLGRRLGSLIYRHNKKRRNVVVTNLSIAFPHLTQQELQAKAMLALEWYGCALVDYCVLFFYSPRRLHKRIRLDGKMEMDQAISAGKNVIILLLHSAWLDFAPVKLGAEYSLYGSYKAVKNPVINWLMAKSRCKHVDFVIAREEGMMKLVRSLKPGKLLILLPDEDLGIEHAEFAPFFGKDKATLTTPARIAKLKDAACFPCYTYYDVGKGQYCVKLGEMLSPFPADNALKSAQTLNKSMEALIYIEPDQYMWQLKYYKTRPKKETSLYSV